MSYPRTSVDLSGYPDLVVIYLGFRVNGPKSLLMLPRIRRGLMDIERNPPPGLLAHENMKFGLLQPGFRQYWRDMESLEAFTRTGVHTAWWRDFAKGAGAGGLWHETYRLRGGMEAIYSRMPAIGLASFAPSKDPVGPYRGARQRVEASLAA